MISDILEMWSQALRLATLSALPVPMLRQVYKTAFSLGTSTQKWALDDVKSMLL